jgi:hypothetical protein
MSVLLAALVAPLALSAAPTRAQNIIDEWASVKAPAAPALKPVTVNPKTTALLMLDFMNQNCGKRPRCLASIPVMKKLLGEARAAKAAVVYSLIHNSTTDDVIKDVAPTTDEPWVISGPDKFLNTDLEKIFKDRGIETVSSPEPRPMARCVHRIRSGAARHERDRASRRHVGIRSLRRADHGLHPCQCALDLAEDNIDHNRHDQVLSDTGSVRLLSFVADGTASRSVAIKDRHCR